MNSPEEKIMERHPVITNLVIKFSKSTILKGTNIYLSIWEPVIPGKFPLILFQSGYGSNSKTHRFFLESIAKKGYVVISVDRTDDLRCGWLGNIGFLSGLSCSAMSTDGSHLGIALNYAKKNMNNIDVDKVVMMGFSMGAQEAVHAQARYPNNTKAVVLVSGSFNIPLATFLGLNPCCYPCSGGNCTFCSDTPIKMCTSNSVIKDYEIPSLLITSENDMVKSGMYRTHNNIGGDSTLITFKDSVLNLNIPNTKKETYWGCFSNLACYGCPFYGLPRHFGIGAEDDITSNFIVSFLNKIFYNQSNIENNINLDLLYDNKLNSRAPNKCCAPFPLFVSCCNS